MLPLIYIKFSRKPPANIFRFCLQISPNFIHVFQNFLLILPTILISSVLKVFKNFISNLHKFYSKFSRIFVQICPHFTYNRRKIFQKAPKNKYSKNIFRFFLKFYLCFPKFPRNFTQNFDCFFKIFTSNRKFSNIRPINFFQKIFFNNFQYLR